MFLIGHAEQADTRRATANHAQGRKGETDEFGLIGDQHQLVSLNGREAGDDGAVAANIVYIGDTLATAPGAAIFKRR